MTIIGGVLIVSGVLLSVLAGVGILRFPDVLTRAQAATKAAGLGVAAVFAGVAFMIGTTEAFIKLGIAVMLQFGTVPIAGHVIARAAYRAGAPIYEGTHTDDLAGWVDRPHDPSAWL